MIQINVDPVAFRLGSVEVAWYGIAIALAIVTMVVWMSWRIKRGEKIALDTLFTAAIVGIPSGIIISRLLHVVDRWDYYINGPGNVIGGQGLTIFGAIIGATLGIWVYSRFSKFPFGNFMDVLAPGIILAQIVGRIGCVLNGCCYGSPTDLPWAIVYSNGNPVHPTQIYEIIFLAIMFVIVFFWLRGRLRPQGSLFLVYLGLYSAWRLGIGFIREGSDFLFGLHQAQIVGIVALAIIIPLLVIRTKWQKKGEETPEEILPSDDNAEEIASEDEPETEDDENKEAS